MKKEIRKETQHTVKGKNVKGTLRMRTFKELGFIFNFPIKTEKQQNYQKMFQALCVLIVTRVYKFVI